MGAVVAFIAALVVAALLAWSVVLACLGVAELRAWRFAGVARRVVSVIEFLAFTALTLPAFHYGWKALLLVALLCLLASMIARGVSKLLLRIYNKKASRAIS